MRKSYTYGILPPFEDFAVAFDDEKRRDAPFNWVLQDYDARVMEEIGFCDREQWYLAESLYRDLKKMIESDSAHHWRILDIVSSILTVLGFEWV